MDLVDYDKHKTQKIPQKPLIGVVRMNFYDSSDDDNTDLGDEDGNQEHHLEKLDIKQL